MLQALITKIKESNFERMTPAAKVCFFNDLNRVEQRNFLALLFVHQKFKDCLVLANSQDLADLWCDLLFAIKTPEAMTFYLQHEKTIRPWIAQIHPRMLEQERRELRQYRFGLSLRNFSLNAGMGLEAEQCLVFQKVIRYICLSRDPGNIILMRKLLQVNKGFYSAVRLLRRSELDPTYVRAVAAREEMVEVNKQIKLKTDTARIVPNAVGEAVIIAVIFVMFRHFLFVSILDPYMSENYFWKCSQEHFSEEGRDVMFIQSDWRDTFLEIGADLVTDLIDLMRDEKSGLTGACSYEGFHDDIFDFQLTMICQEYLNRSDCVELRSSSIDVNGTRHTVTGHLCDWEQISCAEEYGLTDWENPNQVFSFLRKFPGGFGAYCHSNPSIDRNCLSSCIEKGVVLGLDQVFLDYESLLSTIQTIISSENLFLFVMLLLIVNTVIWRFYKSREHANENSAKIDDAGWDALTTGNFSADVARVLSRLQLSGENTVVSMYGRLLRYIESMDPFKAPTEECFSECSELSRMSQYVDDDPRVQTVFDAETSEADNAPLLQERRVPSAWSRLSFMRNPFSERHDTGSSHGIEMV
jgi:hypothetical protein